MLGTAAGTTARAYARYLPDTRIDAVEIDGELLDIGRRYFDLRAAPAAARRSPRTRGRSCAAPTERYDVIIVDAYRQPYIPFYLTTEEFFELARDRLAPGGVGGDQRRPSGGLRPAREGAQRHAALASSPTSRATR